MSAYSSCYIVLAVITFVCFVIGIVLIAKGSRASPPYGYNVKVKGRVIRVRKTAHGCKPVFRYHYYNDMVETATVQKSERECELKPGDRIDIYLLYNNRSLCWYRKKGFYEHIKVCGTILILMTLSLDVIASALLFIFKM